jgi:flagellin FlaB
MRENRQESAFTGLETALVFIAFVVVAAVFSYIVLGAGFFATQKSQEGIHSGLTHTASNSIIKGDMYAIADDANKPTGIQYLQFDICLTSGGFPVDMNRTTMTFSSVTVEPYTLIHDYSIFNTKSNPEAGQWTIYSISEGSTNDMTLQAAETFTIRVRLQNNLAAREKFMIEVRPEAGAPFGIERTVPSAITYINRLY